MGLGTLITIKAMTRVQKLNPRRARTVAMAVVTPAAVTPVVATPGAQWEVVTPSQGRAEEDPTGGAVMAGRTNSMTKKCNNWFAVQVR